jgi:arylsulfatase A-like enzyme
MDVTRRAFLGAAAAAPAFAQKRRPNIIFVLLDDLRHDALGCTGHPRMKTPHIDRVAREGAVMRNAFAVTPLCSPSRASFLTGLYPHTHRIVNNDNHGLSEISHTLMTWPRLLHEVGYETGFIGKWHMGFDDAQRPGFDHWISFRGQGTYIEPLVNADGRHVQLRTYMTDYLNESACKFIERKRRDPFALVLSHKAVHIPYLPAKRHEDLYNDVTYTERQLDPADRAGKKVLSRKITPVDRFKLLGATAEPAEPRRGRGREPVDIIRDQMRCLASVDEGMGMLFDSLRKAGALDDTVVIFAGDNGYFLGEHGEFDGKRWAWEDSIRIPFLMRYPGVIRPGSEMDEMVLNIDLAPTLLEIGGMKWPEKLHGSSMMPLFNGSGATWRDRFQAEYFAERTGPRTPDWQAIRTKKWKYIRYPVFSGMEELYDLETDPGEIHNIADRKDLVRELDSELTRMI